MTEFVSGNIYIREDVLEKEGQQVPGHAHSFDHTTYVPRGALRVERLDEAGNAVQSVEISAANGQNWVLIKAGVKHRLTALEPFTRYHCIYSHRSPNPDGDHVIVQEWDGWEGATA
jgi:quercetin dioxygenase-like cupin family protein